jgi:uncharacterized membrane protein YbhN (UPF0104 family)
VTVTGRRLLVVVGLGVAVFAGLTVAADVRGLGHRLAGFRWPAFAAALGLALTNYALRFVRWQRYLRRAEVPVPTGLSVRIFVAGFALSVTPGKVGELI